jgi:hypothetical protein
MGPGNGGSSRSNARSMAAAAALTAGAGTTAMHQITGFSNKNTAGSGSSSGTLARLARLLLKNSASSGQIVHWVCC